MSDRPPALAGFLILQDEVGHQLFGGTTFALWDDTTAVTAAHCLVELPPRWTWRVAWHGLPSRGVLAVERHASADLAVLRLEDGPTDGMTPFELGPWPEAGEDVALFGYAYDVEHPEAGHPTDPGSEIRRGRCGPIGSSAEFGVPAPYEFTGARLRSVSATPGFSGGPVFEPSQPDVAVGLTTSYAYGEPRYLAPGVPVEPDRDTFALTLADSLDWLADQVPRSCFRSSSSSSTSASNA